ncbi:MAG: hypothetical protein WKF59_11430 [Chitinophagaceae bacterium]
MKKLISLIFSIWAIGSCTIDKKNFITKPFKKPLLINEIKLNGIYIGVYPSPLGGKEIGCFILYDNGIALLYEPIQFIEDSIENLNRLKQQYLRG